MFSTLHAWLPVRREAVGLLTQRALRDALAAQGAKVSTRAISKWEQGMCKPARVHREALWNALQVSDPELRRQAEMALDGWAEFPDPAPADPSESSAA